MHRPRSVLAGTLALLVGLVAAAGGARAGGGDLIFAEDFEVGDLARWSSLEPQPAAGASFANWEAMPVHGLDLTPDGSLLLAVNTADDRLEVFDLTGGGLPTPVASYPVGLAPVSVRALSNDEAWVVNRLSDSVSIVDLDTGNLEATLRTGDEPADVLFTGSPLRAYVSVAFENEVWIYDPVDPGAAPLRVPIQGEDPRALATDGAHVYAAVFESGNRTTYIREAFVADPSGPYGGQNPPPNSGSGFDPPLNPDLPPPPSQVVLVQKDGGGVWRDVNGADWSAFVPWDVLDHDVAAIDVGPAPAVTYTDGLMNIVMGVAVAPDGRVAVVGTDATNVVRFEPNVRGTFVRVLLAVLDSDGDLLSLADANPHLTYATPSVPPGDRILSVADPRAVVWSPTGDRVYVSGMGSNNVVAIAPGGARLGRVEVGEGPTSLAVDAFRGRLYVLNRFDGSVSTVSIPSLAHLGAVPFFDPTPPVIEAGRPLLYDAHDTSGLGQVACASCHVDAHMDQIAWDLGDPTGEMKTFNASCAPDVVGFCEDWHPVKGPLMTQSLRSIQGTGSLHWRGDREDVAAFAPAFVGLQGADAEPSAGDMQALTDFLATVRFPPNPYRNLDHSMRSTPIANGGVPSNGSFLFNEDPSIIHGIFTCSHCHEGPLGTSGNAVPRTGPPSPAFKIASLRSAYQKVGMDQFSSQNTRGFGMTADGTMDSVYQGLEDLGFTFPDGPLGLQWRRDVEAFVWSFGGDAHAALGQQVTIHSGNVGDDAELDRLDALVALADDASPGPPVGLVVKFRRDGVLRGSYYVGAGLFRADVAAETVTLGELLDGVGPGASFTATVVPFEARVRTGVDRDEDGKLDRDEVLAGTDPADPAS